MDSYKKFLEYFQISKEDFFDWGIKATIFPPLERVQKEWGELKFRIFNDKPVYIRGYGRDAHGTQLYLDLYKYLFNNKSILKDPSNNIAPTRLIEKSTGLKKNKTIYNYQVSHIWGKTKNVFLFEAPWNICYAPKIMDPFTGHEAMGDLPAEYKEAFIRKVYEIYENYIADYNRILVDNEVGEKLNEYLYSIKNNLSTKEYERFCKDVKDELSPISL